MSRNSSNTINRRKSRNDVQTRVERRSSIDESRNNYRVCAHSGRKSHHHSSYSDSHYDSDSNVGPRSRSLRDSIKEKYTNRENARNRSRSPIRKEKTNDRHPNSRNHNKSYKTNFKWKKIHHHHSPVDVCSNYNMETEYSNEPIDNDDEAWDWSTGKQDIKSEDNSENVTDKDQKTLEDKTIPNFERSGKLTAETNTFKGVVIKYCEPPEARKPTIRWRLYPFKGDEPLPVLYIHRQSAYLIGRDRLIADFPINHPSCSKQHAVFQYRIVQIKNPDGGKHNVIKPYIIDLGSANGTYINNKRIEPKRYIELKQADMIKFGYSTREYILLNENSNAEHLGLAHIPDENAAPESPASNDDD